MASVSFDRIVKRYGDNQTIHGISFEINEGEFVALVGPSGCGKSTLLRMVAGLEEINGGEIRVDGRVVNELTPRERNIAMVFQNYALYPHMTVRENMGFSLKLQKAAPRAINEKINWAAGILGLEALLDRLPANLSGGQRQRVAMGRAIVRDSQVFLFDEPLSNLDAQLRVQMRAEIKQLHQSLRNTMIYVTHDQIEAMTMADKVVVMRAGHIEQIGAPLELYDRPVNLFVARFIGSPAINLLAGIVQRSAIGSVLDLGDGTLLPLPAGMPTGLVGKSVTVGIRPEHVDLGDAGGLNAEVVVVEPTGSDTQILTRIGQHKLVLLSRERLAASVGQQLRVRFDPSKLHIFDTDTGQRIAIGA
ncbi:MAG: sn-glycerol-3-phosphate ABC transporter ATP-binding protein UgpC [Rhodocyclaceae bacterium]|nr:sn-glycerol-3-phosphate ABC transporter ATP-binding protein UgpC [Rhodocyclaceae bacterium]